MPTFNPALGLLIYAGLIALVLAVVFAQLKLFSIARDVRSILDLLEKRSQPKDG